MVADMIAEFQDLGGTGTWLKSDDAEGNVAHIFLMPDSAVLLN